MKSRTYPALRVALLGLVFVHGAFAAGMVPLLNASLGERSSLAFVLYFGGMVAGQAAIYFVPALSRPDKALAVFEVGFALTVVAMALSAHPTSLLWLRGVEGIGSGLTLPLLFSQVVRLEAWGSPERRIGLMNGSFALGFVLGPLVVEGLLGAIGQQRTLLVFALALGTVAVALFGYPSPPLLRERSATPRASGLAIVFPLGLAKLSYGYLLAFLGGHASELFAWPVSWVMLALALLFGVGQVGAVMGVRRLGLAALVKASALLLALSFVFLGTTGRGEALFVMILGYSSLLLLGFRMFVGQPGDARSFAGFNLATDPALVVGALLASAGPLGALGAALTSSAALVVRFPGIERSTDGAQRA